MIVVKRKWQIFKNSDVVHMFGTRKYVNFCFATGNWTNIYLRAQQIIDVKTMEFTFAQFQENYRIINQTFCKESSADLTHLSGNVHIFVLTYLD